MLIDLFFIFQIKYPVLPVYFKHRLTYWQKPEYCVLTANLRDKPSFTARDITKENSSKGSRDRTKENSSKGSQDRTKENSSKGSQDRTKENPEM